MIYLPIFLGIEIVADRNHWDTDAERIFSEFHGLVTRWSFLSTNSTSLIMKHIKMGIDSAGSATGGRGKSKRIQNVRLYIKVFSHSNGTLQFGKTVPFLVLVPLPT